MPVVVSDIIGEITQVTGKCQQSYLFSVLTRAVETLARKSCATSITWDPLLTYLDLPVQNDFYVFLPYQVEKPIKINLNSNPSFSHSQLYEFTQNGPGSNDLEAGWQWQDRGTWPIQRKFPRGAFTLAAQSDSEADIDLYLHMLVRLRDRSEVYIDLPIWPANTTIQPDTNQVIEILQVVKPVTIGTVKLGAGPYVLAYYYPAITLPQFHQIKLSQRAVSVRMLARKRTAQITSLLDVIPLNSAQAIKMMAQAIKYYDEVHYDLAGVAEQTAVTFLSEEQAARNAYSVAAGATEIATALNLTIGQRDSIVVADIYDEACRIFGFIGRQKVFDAITSTLELLYNKAQWDGLIGYVDIRADEDFYCALPRYVDQIIALNVNGQRGVFRNKWFEFNLNSLGEFCDQYQDPRVWVPWDQLVCTEKSGCGCRVTPYGCFGTSGFMRNNRPPYGWEEVGQVPIAFRMKGPSQLYAVPELAQDNNASITVYGYNQEEPVCNKNGTWGIRIPCRKSSATPTKQIFTSIERVTKDPTYGFISLWATNPYAVSAAPAYPGYVPGAVPSMPASLGLAGGVLIDNTTATPPVPDPPPQGNWPQVQFLSLYWPQDTEPSYRQIRIGAFCKRIRVRYRKNYLKVSDLTDPIHVRNRTAIILAMTGLQAMKQGGGGASISAFMPTAGVQIAADQINMAVDMLNDEWRVMHPSEGISIQWDSRVYGNAFPQIL
jgi:hypothetical protein